MSGIYVKLDASYHQDPKMLDLADERAELLFVRGLTYCKTHLTDGVIHRRALASFAPFTDDIAPADLAAMLVETGAWQVHPKGWIVPAWLNHNKAADDILTPRKGAELAHRRHHVKKGVVNPECEFCQAENPQVNADGCGNDTDRNADPQCGDAMPEPEPETETSPTDSQSVTDSTPPGPVAAADDQQSYLAAAAAVARIEAGVRAADGGYVAGVRREILTGPDPTRRNRIRSLLADHDTPEAVAAAWATSAPDPLTGYPVRDVAPETRPRLAEWTPPTVEVADPAVARAALAAARGRTPEPEEAAS